MYHNSYQRYNNHYNNNTGFGSSSFSKLRTQYSIEPSRTSITTELIDKRKYNSICDEMDKMDLKSNINKSNTESTDSNYDSICDEMNKMTLN